MKIELQKKGFSIVEGIYTHEEIDRILALIRTKDLGKAFGVRSFLTDHPDVARLVFTDRLIGIVKEIAPTCTQSIKSIYFDKPPNANWIVNWHQDLTINVTHKAELEGYKNWRTKDERTIVQPTREMLESIFTIRIHLDDCSRKNGALKVINGSHNKGVIDIKSWHSNGDTSEELCEVGKGGIVLMKPLTLHASRRTENHQNRRVIHIEFTDATLPQELEWKEKIEF